MRDFGAIQAPQNAFYLNLGLQTLDVRMKRHTESALTVATFLRDPPAVAWIHFPDLPGDKEYERARKYLPDGSCGVMAFALKGGRTVDNTFMDSLRLVTIETHVADCHTCILHPASHTHRQRSDEQLREAGIAPDLMRLSIGLEDPEDIIADLAQAIETATR
jgi:O-acetylhomoserine (thiol)-lyase